MFTQRDTEVSACFSSPSRMGSGPRDERFVTYPLNKPATKTPDEDEVRQSGYPLPNARDIFFRSRTVLDLRAFLVSSSKIPPRLLQCTPPEKRNMYRMLFSQLVLKGSI